MKKGLLLAILCGWLHNMHAQSSGSLQQYCYMGEKQVFTIVPVACFTTANNWYFEGRYNYEELKTFSLYMGKTFEKNGKLSYTITPMAGLVKGALNGGSIGANVELEYKKFSCSSQSQYTFSTQDNTCNFIYNWSDASYSLAGWLSAGLSIQHTKLYRVKGLFEKGVFINVKAKEHEFSFYVFNPEKRDRYFVLGFYFAWQHTKKTGANIHVQNIHARYDD
jgi:hypothetical protein